MMLECRKTITCCWRLLLVVAVLLWSGYCHVCPLGFHKPVRQIGNCSGVEYFPEEQSCCEETLHNIPETTHAQCCGDKAYWRNETKPDSCTVDGCGWGRFHQDTEICCNKKAVWVGRHGKTKFCCGSTIVDSETHECCGNFPIEKQSGYGCCGILDKDDAKPYHNATMSCNDKVTPYDVTLNTRQLFRVSEVCDRKLPEWDTNRPLPRVADGFHVHIRGWVEKCTIRIKRQKGGSKIYLSLTPFFSTDELDETCANSQTVRVIFKIKKGQTCCVNRKELQDYFYGKTVDIFFRKGMKCKNGVLRLRLKDGYNAVMYVSTHHSNVILAQWS